MQHALSPALEAMFLAVAGDRGAGSPSPQIEARAEPVLATLPASAVALFAQITHQSPAKKTERDHG